MLKRVAIIMVALVMLGMMLLPALETVVQGMDEHYSGYYDKCDEDEPDPPELPDGIHCCSGLHDFEEWQCPICDAEDCDCYLVYCMRCAELHDDCDCEFEGIMPTRNCLSPHCSGWMTPGPFWPACWVCGQRQRTLTCGTCGATTGELPGCGHCAQGACSMSWRQTASATCIADGLQTQHCTSSTCNRAGSSRALPLARGHNLPDEWFIENDVTMTSDGNERRNCLHAAGGGFAACSHYETRTLYRVIYNAVVIITDEYGEVVDEFIFTEAADDDDEDDEDDDDYNNYNSRNSYDDGYGNFLQGILSGENATPPIMNIFSECGRRVWQGWDDDGEDITEARVINPAPFNDRSFRYDEDGNDLGHGYPDGSIRRHRVHYISTTNHNGEVFTFTRTAASSQYIQFIEHTFDATPVVFNELSSCGRRFFPGGWSHNGENITEPTEITFNPLDSSHIRKHEVTFVLYNDGLEGAHSGGGSLRQIIEHTKNAVPPSVDDPFGHAHSGWDSDEGYNNILEPTTLTAVYEPNPFFVIFLNYDETEHARVRTLFGEAARAPADPVKPMHNFSGWSEVDFTIRSEANLIVHPIFTISCANDGRCDNEENLCSDCGRCQDCCNCCAIGGCDNTDLCEDCGRCRDCCNCCAVGGCDNTDLCSDCGKCQDCCNCCAVDGCENTDLCSDCGRCRDCCNCVLPLAIGGDDGNRVITTGTMPLGTPPMFSFMGRNIYLFAPLHIASWSIVNLLLTVLGAIFVIVKLLQKKKGDETAEKPEEQGQHKKKWLLPAYVFGAIAILLFALTQDMTALIALLDTWTIAHTAIFIIQIICIKAHNRGPGDEENQQDNEAPEHA